MLGSGRECKGWIRERRKGMRSRDRYERKEIGEERGGV